MERIKATPKNATPVSKSTVRDMKTFEKSKLICDKLLEDLKGETVRLNKMVKAITPKSVEQSGKRGTLSNIEEAQQVAKWLDAQATDIQKVLTMLKSSII